MRLRNPPLNNTSFVEQEARAILFFEKRKRRGLVDRAAVSGLLLRFVRKKLELSEHNRLVKSESLANFLLIGRCGSSESDHFVYAESDIFCRDTPQMWRCMPLFVVQNRLQAADEQIAAVERSAIEFILDTLEHLASEVQQVEPRVR